MGIPREELLKVCKELNDKYVIKGRYWNDFGGEHYSHQVARLLREALKNNPDLGVDVEGWIELDITGDGVSVLGCLYINVGDPYIKTITWRNQDPMRSNIGCFRVEGWGDAKEKLEQFHADWEEYHLDDPDDDPDECDEDGLVYTLNEPTLAAARI